MASPRPLLLEHTPAADAEPSATPLLDEILALPNPVGKAKRKRAPRAPKPAPTPPVAAAPDYYRSLERSMFQRIEREYVRFTLDEAVWSAPNFAPVPVKEEAPDADEASKAACRWCGKVHD